MKRKISDKSTLYITSGAVLFLGSIIDTDLHSHHSIQLTFSIDNLFTVNIGGKELQSGSVVINSNIEHKLTGKDSIQALLLIEPESFYGNLIKQKINSDYVLLNFDDNFYRAIKEIIFSDNLSIVNLMQIIFDYWGIALFPVKIEDRIIKTISLIENSDEKKISIKQLADNVSLSESRLQHIFKKQTGISIKRYLLWKRLMDGINVIVKGKDFTFASHESGFSDSSHMSRTFKEMFGINLSEIFKNSRSIQVVIQDMK